IGLPSGKSLFQIQAERIHCLQRLAVQSTNEGSANITFFSQGTIPCVSKDGRFIMETPFQVAKAPDGNGGVYSALKYSGLLEHMSTRGVKYLDCYGVDNALVRVGDPTFLGYFIDKGVASAAKVVRKAYPQENVGVFVRRGKGGPVTVVEYSELDQSLASEINQGTGRLRYCWSNVCLHMFTLDFLNQVANNLEKDSVYHLAEKKIPSIHGQTVGYKLEQFIFDAFPYAPSTALYEVLREEEFAPVKNANGSNFDTPDSARLLVLRLHTRWVVAAGGFLTHSVPLYSTGVEVSPLVSYAGENLEAICRGRTFHAPCEITF
ncbi:UDP-N-acetylglucosamine diphosphorylase 1, partial [Tanacetum coccineum]